MLGSKLNPKATTAAQTAAAYKPILTKDSAIRPPSNVPAVEGYGGANVMAIPEIRSSGVSTGTLLKPVTTPARPPASLPNITTPKPPAVSAGGGYAGGGYASSGSTIQPMAGGTINAPASITNASSNPSAPTISTRPPTTPTASSAPTAPTTSTTIASSPANSQLEALRKSLLSFYQETPDEKAAREAYDAIIAQQANLAASEEMGLAGISNQPIELGLIRGQQEALQKQAVAQQRGLSAQALPLEQRLAGIQAQREQQRKMAEAELGFATKDMEGEKPIEVGGNLVRLNPQTGQYEIAYEGASKDAEGFTLGEGQMRYDAQGNLIASGGEKKETKPATIQEYEYAKGQGFNGSYLDYQAAKESLSGLGISLSGSQISDALSKGYKSKEDMAQYARMLADGVVPPAADRSLSVEQSKARQFAMSADQANKVLDVIDYNPGFIEFEGLPNQLKGEKRQQFEQASRAFVNSVLRRESGATITDDEFNNKYLELIPRAGDSKAVKDQKAIARATAVKSIQEAGFVDPSVSTQSISELRQKYPQYNNLPDDVLLEAARDFPTP